MIRENNRKGIMQQSKQFIKDYEIYKSHSLQLQKIKDVFENDGHKFNNMSDVENILLLLSLDSNEEEFLETSSDDGDCNDINIFNNKFFNNNTTPKPFS